MAHGGARSRMQAFWLKACQRHNFQVKRASGNSLPYGFAYSCYHFVAG
eukprot:CAMPEP_0184378674 /NCGR_PEP_ID=MMETSP0007-20130409/3268_1 /TAXON_ID=97485 /ORGANISM="Prymnesium parvum, Strain Texoma1" /LENGTH=47 /DNA_ID= /DNA_START= /DNA_END= /DNA_ORIENTATION=